MQRRMQQVQTFNIITHMDDLMNVANVLLALRAKKERDELYDEFLDEAMDDLSVDRYEYVDWLELRLIEERKNRPVVVYGPMG